MAYYLEWFADNGFEVQSESLTRSSGGIFGSLEGSHPDSGRSVSAAISGAEGSLQIMVRYAGEAS